MGEGLQRRARQAPGLARKAGPQRGGPLQGGVGHDQGVDMMRQRSLDDHADLFADQVRRDLQEDRGAVGRPGLVDAPQQVVQRLAALKRAQARRIGRGDVDGEIVGQARQTFQARDIVGRLVLGVLVGAQIGADGRALRTAGQTRGEGLQPLVVEAHAVDDGPVFGQAEQAWLGIARLRAGRDRAAFDGAETEPRQALQRLAVLVQTRGQTDRIGHLQPGDAGLQDRIVRAGRGQGRDLQGADGQAVRGLGVHLAQDDGAEVGQAHGSSLRIISPSALTDRARAPRVAATGRGP